MIAPNPHTQTGYVVERVWKRDGSRNVMPLEIAVENLAHNGVKPEDARERLWDGGTVHTERAWFRMAAGQ
jgi:hypothetical protein